MPVSSDIYYHSYQGGKETNHSVILIHGAGGNHLYWPPEIRRLPGFEVLALDLPGHGKSGGCGQQTITAYAQQVVEWIKEIGRHRCVFVGHSMGSAIVQRIAVDYPEHVQSLALIGAGARLRVRPDILADTAIPTTLQKAIDGIMEGAFGPTCDSRLVDLAGKRMREVRQSVLHGDFLACNAFDMMEEASLIGQPTLLICGAEDRMTPLRYSQYLLGAIPNARLEVIPGAGHMVQLEKPQAVVEVLVRFLEQVQYE